MSLARNNCPMVGEGTKPNHDLETRVLGSTLCCACQPELMRQGLDLFLNLQGRLEMFLECLWLDGCQWHSLFCDLMSIIYHHPQRAWPGRFPPLEVFKRHEKRKLQGCLVKEHSSAHWARMQQGGRCRWIPRSAISGRKGCCVCVCGGGQCCNNFNSSKLLVLGILNFGVRLVEISGLFSSQHAEE